MTFLSRGVRRRVALDMVSLEFAKVCLESSDLQQALKRAGKRRRWFFRGEGWKAMGEFCSRALLRHKIIVIYRLLIIDA